MSSPQSKNFVSTEWLEKNLKSPDLAIIDGSWHLPPMKRDARAEYLAAHIPGAVFFNIDEIADTTSGLPHMMPQPLQFAGQMKDLGLGDGMRFVVYDQSGLFSAPRVWWMLKSFGVTDVKILAGGLPKWVAEGRETDSGPVHRTPRVFTPRLDHSAVATLNDVAQASASGNAQIIDARPADRFRGEAPEPRAGVASGHIPGSLNLPFPQIIENGQLKSPQDIAKAFVAAGADLSKPIITSCGSGVSASILAVALEEAGHKVKSIYDGSWAEWGSVAGQPIATGKPKS